ncbi:MAG: NAD-dependent epimerase/dehydratase family protein [Candidatus Bathyarchaeota archaeon]|nr:NAD-dependent epimerase/dehydratase family protein [Candidatus Bathyarchaeota archaeon]
MGGVGVKGFSRVLVTGGAGFIGSHFVDRLMRMDCFVRVVDDLSGGDLGNVEGWLGDSRFEFVRGDLKDSGVAEKAVDGVDVVFHLAANPEVRVAEVDPSVHFRENLVTTFNVLEAMRKSETARLIVFFSSSTVYGEPEEFPTCEDYGPVLPISVYGASKLGCEALMCAYRHTFGVRGLVFRLANVVGGRSGHGVIPDFVRKLRENPEELEILGDGSQSKSYLHVEDLVDAVFVALRRFIDEKEALEVYNVGSLDRVGVKRIAEIVCDEIGLQGLEFRFTGGVDGGRGWKGDVKTMLLSVDKLVSLGWRPKLNSEEAVRLVCRELLRSAGSASV